MIVNNGTGVAPVNLAFSSSRCAALIERKITQYTKLSITPHHCALSVIKTQVFKLLDVFACLSKHCADRKQHSNPGLSTKPI